MADSNDLKWHIRQWKEARYSVNTDMKRVIYHAQQIKRIQDEKLDARSSDT